MDEAHLKILKCPKCGKKLQSNGNLIEGEIVCVKGHVWPITKGIPSLVHPPISEEDSKWIADYDEMAEKYDELVKQYDDWLAPVYRHAVLFSVDSYQGTCCTTGLYQSHPV